MRSVWLFVIPCQCLVYSTKAQNFNRQVCEKQTIPAKRFTGFCCIHRFRTGSVNNDKIGNDVFFFTAPNRHLVLLGLCAYKLIRTYLNPQRILMAVIKLKGAQIGEIFPFSLQLILINNVTDFFKKGIPGFFVLVFIII